MKAGIRITAALILWAAASPEREIRAAAGASDGAAARREIAAWRAEQDREMRGEKSPFAVESVRALARESNRIGRAPDADLRLDAAGVPEVAATALVRGQDCILRAHSPLVRLNGRRFSEKTLAPSDWVAIGPFRLQFRRPDGRPALRVSNLRGAAMRAYNGLSYFPVDLRYRLPAEFTPAGGGAKLVVEATRGGPQELPLAGRLSFDFDGRPFRLDAFVDADEPDKLFVIFRDATAGKETYPVGRYVYVRRPPAAGGLVTLDFNQAFNPLCAYGPLFFCPIPPRGNHLPFAIPAGEKTYPTSHD